MKLTVGSSRRLSVWHSTARSALAIAAMLPVQALAQNAENAGGIGEIVVTAQKREQNLQDVPVAVTAIAGDALESNRVRNVVDLAGLAPNLTVRASAGGGLLPSITMRGARAQASMPGSEKQVGMYIDGVYIGSNTGSLFDFPSIERIEVLRGPQGTLFGQSATGGAISVYTPDPTGEFGGDQVFTYGNFDQFRSRTRVNLPAFGPVSIALAYEHAERRGDVRNSGAGTQWDFVNVPEAGFGVQTSPKYLGSSNSETIQAAVKFTPSDAFDLSYKFYWVDTDATPEATGNTGIDLATLGGFFVGSPQAEAFGQAVVAALQGYPVYPRRPRELNNWYTMPMHIKNQGHIVTANLRLADSLTAKNVFGYLKSSYRSPGNQLDGLGGVNVFGFPFIVLVNGTVGRTKQWSNELQFNYDSELVTVTAGYLHYDIEYEHGGPKKTPVTPSFTLFPGFVVPRAEGATQSLNFNKADALYGQVEVHVTPQVDLVGGIRYTWDKKTGSANYPNLPTSFRYKDSRATYTLGVNYEATPDILLYGKYATAYVAGGSYAGVPWDPETAKSWEAGVKADLLDRRLRANLALFTVKYNGLQVTASGRLQAQISGRPELAVLPQLMFNAGNARAKGFEFELTAAPAKGLTLNGSLGYTDFKYTQTDPLKIGPVDLVRPLIRPKWTANLGMQYDTQPVIGDAYVTMRMDANYVGPYETVALDPSPALAGLGHVNGTWLINGRLALADFDLGGVETELALWGRNLTNNRNKTYSFTAGFANNATYQRARTYGADLTVKF